MINESKCFNISKNISRKKKVAQQNQFSRFYSVSVEQITNFARYARKVFWVIINYYCVSYLNHPLVIFWKIQSNFNDSWSPIVVYYIPQFILSSIEGD